MTLSFFVEKQKITRTDTETPAANSNCYLKAKFEFGDDWDTSSSVCPIFRRGGEDSGYMPKLTNGSFLDGQNICFVPIEVLNKEGRFFVSILDYKSGKTITTNEAMVEVSRSGPVFNSPTIYGLDLRFENENLQLTANGEAVGEGVEIPKQEIDDAMSDTSENPVQNKVIKAYTDEKTKATPTDIALTDNILQLTANGEAVGSGAELPKVTVDSELSADSENPVQNKAVSAALHDIEQAVNSECANSLKRTATIRGETTIEDIAPHSSLNISGAQPGQIITIRGKNLLKAIPERTRPNIDITDNGIVVSSSVRNILLDTEELAALHLKPGAAVTTSADAIGENMSGVAGQVSIVTAVSGISSILLRGPRGARTINLPEDYDPKNYLGLCLYGECTYKNLQIEYGTEATEYEQGFDDVTVTADADGNAAAENIAYPTAVIETDSACTVEYNRDANRVIEKLEQAILSLGGDI